MNIDEAILERRSVRRFTDKEVTPEKLTDLVKAGIWAPTGGNAQPWEFIIINSPVALKLIKTVSPGLLGNPSACIAVCSEAIMDCSMAAQNIMLKAYDLELGSCVIRSFNRDAVRMILKAPENIMPELLITQGYFEGNPGNPKRKEVVIHWNIP